MYGKWLFTYVELSKYNGLWSVIAKQNRLRYEIRNWSTQRRRSRFRNQIPSRCSIQLCKSPRQEDAQCLGAKHIKVFVLRFFGRDVRIPGAQRKKSSLVHNAARVCLDPSDAAENFPNWATNLRQLSVCIRWKWDRTDAEHNSVAWYRIIRLLPTRSVNHGWNAHWRLAEFILRNRKCGMVIIDNVRTGGTQRSLMLQGDLGHVLAWW